MIKTIINKIKIRNHLKKKYPNELLLMQGLHTTKSTSPSILYFSVHRCATRYVLRILKIIENNSDITCIRPDSYFWRGGKLHISPDEVYKKFGYVYGPFLGMDKEVLHVPIPNCDDFKVFLMLRDPRDVLTSFYFHHAFSLYRNPAQQEFINARSAKAMSKSIDEWVLETAPIMKARYDEYFERFHNKPNVLFLKYEDMVEDFSSWLSKLIAYFDLNLSEKAIDSIRETANFNVAQENEKSHKRQVVPGDHKRKLKSETIQALNAQFHNYLTVYNYEI